MLDGKTSYMGTYHFTIVTMPHDDGGFVSYVAGIDKIRVVDDDKDTSIFLVKRDLRELLEDGLMAGGDIPDIFYTGYTATMVRDPDGRVRSIGEDD